MRAHHPVLISLCVSILSLSAACTDTVGPAQDLVQSPPPTAVVQTVTLSPAQATLSAGGHVIIKATPMGPNGKPIATKVRWSSSDTTIATVSDSGNVVAVAPGNAVITATANGTNATAAVDVVQSSADSVTVAPQKADVTVGQTVQLSVAAGGQTPTGGVTWASSNSQIATVTSSGLVTGISAGIASIRATIAGHTAISTITVIASSGSVTASVASVTLDRSNMSMTVGDSTQITATVRDSAGTLLDGRAITWTSSNPAVASVSSTGLVTAKGAGSANVTATSEGQAGTVAVTVAAVAGGSSGSVWSDEPAGMHVLTDNPWNSLTPSGWTPMGTSSGNIRIGLDANAPVSPSSVLEFKYPAGYSGSGYAPGSEYFTGFDGSKELFVAFDWKVSADWQQHSAGFSKLLYIVHCSYCSSTNNRIAYVMMMQGRVGGPYHLMMNDEIYNTNKIQPNVGDGTVVPGRWYRVEISVKAQSASGANDGWIKFWIDGKPVAQYLNMPLPARGFDQLTIDPVWGGVDPTISKSHTDYMWFDHIHVSVK